jgi:predicted lipid-binding transport protein (Tim44 family)
VTFADDNRLGQETELAVMTIAVEAITVGKITIMGIGMVGIGVLGMTGIGAIAVKITINDLMIVVIGIIVQIGHPRARSSSFDRNRTSNSSDNYYRDTNKNTNQDNSQDRRSNGDYSRGSDYERSFQSPTHIDNTEK